MGYAVYASIGGFVAAKVEHEVHMISFRRIGTMACSVAFGNGDNLHSWHLDILEDWLVRQRYKQFNEEQAAAIAETDGSDLV